TQPPQPPPSGTRAFALPSLLPAGQPSPEWRSTGLHHCSPARRTPTGATSRSAGGTVRPVGPGGEGVAAAKGGRGLRAEDPPMAGQQGGVLVRGGGRIPRLPGPPSEKL